MARQQLAPRLRLEQLVLLALVRRCRQVALQ
jgi:hypothetical protein